MTTGGKMVSPDEARHLPREQLLNEEQPIHPLYAYLYVVDKYEGLIVVNAATLLDDAERAMRRGTATPSHGGHAH